MVGKIIGNLALGFLKRGYIGKKGISRLSLHVNSIKGLVSQVSSANYLMWVSGLHR